MSAYDALVKTVESVPAYLSPYLSASRRHGDAFGSLLWASPRTQELRFAAQTNLVDFSDRIVLDAGCGRADFLTFLQRRGIRPARYIGIEAVAALSAKAQANHRDIEIIEADFVQDPEMLDQNAGVITISGSLNTLDNADFHLTIRRAFQMAREQLVFNFLCSPALAGRSFLQWHDRKDVLAFARSLSPQVSYLDDYLPGDCTIVMRQTEAC